MVAAEELSDTGGLRSECVSADQERSRQFRADALRSDHPELHE
jgi:hypothetical protein